MKKILFDGVKIETNLNSLVLAPRLIRDGQPIVVRTYQFRRDGDYVVYAQRGYLYRTRNVRNR